MIFWYFLHFQATRANASLCRLARALAACMLEGTIDDATKSAQAFNPFKPNEFPTVIK